MTNETESINIKAQCISNIEKIKNDLIERIESKKAAGKKFAVSQSKLDSLVEFESSVWARTLDTANGKWYSQFAATFASANVNHRDATNLPQSFGEGFACLGSAFDGEIESNIYTK